MEIVCARCGEKSSQKEEGAGIKLRKRLEVSAE